MLYNRLYNCTEWDAQRINRELQAADSTLLDEVYAFLRAARRMRGAGCCRYYLTGRGLRLPLRSQVACVELELDCCCYYAAGRGLRLPLLCQAEWVELERLCYYSTGREKLLCSVAVSGVMLPTVSDLRRQNKSAWKDSEVARHPPWPLSAGPAGAAQEEHLLLKRNASAVGLHHATFERLRLSVYMLCQKVRRLDVSFLPRRLWPAGRGWRGKRGRRRPPWQLLRRRLGLEGHAAAAGSRWSCWRSQECFAPSLSRVSCCRLCQCVWPLQRKGEKSLSLFSSFSRFLFLSFGPSLSLPVCLRLRLRLCQESNPRLRLNVRPPWPISETLCEWARPRRRFLVPAPCPESRQNLGRIWAESGRNLGRISAEWGGQGFSCKPPPLSTPPRLILVGWDQPSPTWGLTTQNLRKSRFLERFSSEACVL